MDDLNAIYHKVLECLNELTKLYFVVNGYSAFCLAESMSNYCEINANTMGSNF